MNDNQLTLDDVNLLIDAVGAWVRQPHDAGVNAALIGYMMLPRGIDERYLKQTLGDSEREGREREPAANALIEKLEALRDLLTSAERE